MVAARAVLTCFKKYAVFRGRAGREEYWWFALFAMAGFWAVAALSLACAAMVGDGGDDVWRWLLGGEALWGAAVGIPHAAVGARRLRDTGKSGWLMLAHAVPSGHWAVVALCSAPGDPGENRYGHPEPLMGAVRGPASGVK